jgi:hypothetical protein
MRPLSPDGLPALPTDGVPILRSVETPDFFDVDVPADAEPPPGR